MNRDPAGIGFALLDAHAAEATRPEDRSVGGGLLRWVGAGTSASGSKVKVRLPPLADIGPAIERTRPYIGDWWRTRVLPFEGVAPG